MKAILPLAISAVLSTAFLASPARAQNKPTPAPAAPAKGGKAAPKAKASPVAAPAPSKSPAAQAKDLTAVDLAAFSGVKVGQVLGKSWTVKGIEAAPPHVRFTLVDEKKRTLHFTVAATDGPPSPFDVEGVRIGYQEAELPLSDFEAAGKELGPLLVASAGSTKALKDAVERQTRSATPPEPPGKGAAEPKVGMDLSLLAGRWTVKAVKDSARPGAAVPTAADAPVLMVCDRTLLAGRNVLLEECENLPKELKRSVRSSWIAEDEDGLVRWASVSTPGGAACAGVGTGPEPGAPLVVNAFCIDTGGQSWKQRMVLNLLAKGRATVEIFTTAGSKDAKENLVLSATAERQ